MINRTEEQKARHNQRCKSWRDSNKEAQKAYRKEYYNAHKEEEKAYSKAHNKVYRLAHKEEKKVYRKERPWINRENQAKCRAKKLGCEIYPPEHKRIMVGFYKLSEAMSIETGIQWSVDHIIPTSKGGGHTIFNVQVMPLSENKKKCAKLT